MSLLYVLCSKKTIFWTVYHTFNVYLNSLYNYFCLVLASVVRDNTIVIFGKLLITNL